MSSNSSFRRILYSSFSFTGPYMGKISKYLNQYRVTVRFISNTRGEWCDRQGKQSRKAARRATRFILYIKKMIFCVQQILNFSAKYNKISFIILVF
jgi:hypothetical protein